MAGYILALTKVSVHKQAKTERCLGQKLPCPVSHFPRETPGNLEQAR